MTNLTDFPNTTINDYREAYEDVMFEHYDMDGRYFDDFMCEHEDELANYVMNDGSINLVPAVLKFHGNKHRTSITWNDITNKQINKMENKTKKYTYKDLARDLMHDIGNLIRKYESEGDYYMDSNDEPQLRTSKDFVEDLRNILTAK